MKKKLNVIQIRGIRGLILAGFIITCLFSGFVIFPGYVSMHIWNYFSKIFVEIPSIGILQGILLWGILAGLYFVFSKESLVVCVKSPRGLSEDELKAVFADIKKQSETDPIQKSMMKARKLEMSAKDTNKNNSQDEKEPVSATDSNNI